jgi:hypothetical protein
MVSKKELRWQKQLDLLGSSGNIYLQHFPFLGHLFPLALLALVFRAEEFTLALAYSARGGRLG